MFYFYRLDRQGVVQNFLTESVRLEYFGETFELHVRMFAVGQDYQGAVLEVG